jgi:hypothetical protein
MFEDHVDVASTTASSMVPLLHETNVVSSSSQADTQQVDKFIRRQKYGLKLGVGECFLPQSHEVKAGHWCTALFD